MFEEKIIKKVPGVLLPNPKEKQGYIEDLSSKTKVELLELLERQDKLLANKNFISKLKDKGERIKSFREQLANELKRQDKIGEACNLLSNLSLKTTNVNDEIEWNGKYMGKVASDNENDDSGNESDPLKIIASHSGVDKVKKKSRSLMKYENAKEKESSNLLSVAEEREKLGQMLQEPLVESSASILNELHANKLCTKIDTLPENGKVLFKPHCTTKSGLHPGLHTPKHMGPHWEVTAATPPPPVHGMVKMLSLQESLHLQHEQAAKLKDIQTKHATEKLALHSSVKLGSTLPGPSARSEYREVQQIYDSSSGSDEEENEGQNDGDDDNRDTVVYTYTE